MERASKLRKCQEASWKLLNELDSMASAWRHAAASEETGHHVRQAIQRSLADDMAAAVNAVRGAESDYCSLFPDDGTYGDCFAAKCAKPQLGDTLQLVTALACVREACREGCTEHVGSNEHPTEVSEREYEACVFNSLEVVVEGVVGDKVEEYVDLQCAEGYGGSLCGVCSLGEEGKRGTSVKWGLRVPFSCDRCGGSSTTWFVLSALGVSLLVALATLINLSNNRQGFRDRHYTSDVGKVGEGAQWKCGCRLVDRREGD